MRILLVEDEKPALERMQKALHDYDPSIIIAGRCGSVRDTVDWLQSHPPPDMILMDIQLSDGLSLEIANRVPIPCPVIFVTAYDDYVMQALERNGIDYILKPLRAQRLAAAINKYRILRSQVIGSLGEALHELTQSKPSMRIVGRRGNEFIPVHVEEIAFLYSEHKLVFAVSHDKTRLMLDGSLQELEARLSAHGFFRLNRQYLAHPSAIRSFSPAGKGKVEVTLRADPPRTVLISQEKGQAFRQWLSGENIREPLETSR